ncbi:MAG: hypothetical protein HC860_08805 [Alkalinema sp. RU_4_3]|nr:hypothetical protein [Alkalinema sp. RU_4_3]
MDIIHGSSTDLILVEFPPLLPDNPLQSASAPLPLQFSAIGSNEPLAGIPSGGSSGEPGFFVIAESIEKNIRGFVDTQLKNISGVVKQVSVDFDGSLKKITDFKKNFMTPDNAGDDPAKWVDKDGKPLLPDFTSISKDSVTGTWKSNGKGALNANAQEAVNNREVIRSAIKDSPHKIVVVGGDDGDFFLNPSLTDILPHNFNGFSGDKQFDHVAVAYEGIDGEIKIAELLTGDGYNISKDLSSNEIGTHPGSRPLDDNVIRKHPNGSFVTSYDRITAVPLKNVTAKQAAEFLDTIIKLTKLGTPYSFNPAKGETCASVVVEAAQQTGIKLPFNDKTREAVVILNDYVHLERPSSVVEAFESLNQPSLPKDPSPASVSLVNKSFFEFGAPSDNSFSTLSLETIKTEIINPRLFYRLTLFSPGNLIPIIKTGITNTAGDLVAALVPDAGGLIEVYEPESKSYGSSIFLAGDESTFSLELNYGNAQFATDQDLDGIPDIGETVMGTSPNKADTDEDGISDNVELQNGTLNSLVSTKLNTPFNVFSFQIDPKQHYITDLDTGRISLMIDSIDTRVDPATLVKFKADLTLKNLPIGAANQGNFILIHDINDNGTVDPGEIVSASGSSVNRSLVPGNYYALLYATTDSLNYNLSFAVDKAGDDLSTAYDLGTLFGKHTFADFVGANDSNDYYKFNLNTSKILSLKLNSTDASVSVQLIQDLNKNGILENGEILKATTSTITQTGTIAQNLASGSYFVRVLPDKNNANSNYTIDLTLEQAGNTLPVAQTLGKLDGTRYLYDFVGIVDNNDYYQFTIDTTSNFSLLLNGLGADANVQLIQDRNNNSIVEADEIIQFSANSGKAPEAFSRTLSPGTYAVLVSPGSSTVNTNYSLSLSATAITSTDDSLNTAKSIALGSTPIYVTDWVGSSDNSDFYRFTLSSTSVVNLMLDNLSADANLQVIQDLNSNGLVDSNELLRASNKPGLSSENIQLNLASSTYFVQVYQGTGNTHYCLRATADAIPDSAGNMLATARAVSLKSIASRFNDWIGDADPSDYYRFEVNTDSNLTLLLNELRSDADVRLIKDQNNNGIVETSEILQTSAITGSAAEILNRPLSAGIYFIQILPKTAVSETSYALSLSLDQAGNTLATARSLSLSAAPINVDDWVSSADPNDYYTFTLTKTADLRLNLDGLGAVALKLLDVAGNVIEGFDKSKTSSESIIRQLSAGTYKVLVYSSGESTDYRLQASVTSPDLAGNSLATATDLGVINGELSVRDFVGDGDLEDYRRFRLSTPGSLTIELSLLDADANVQLIQDINGDGLVGSNEILQSSVKTGRNAETLTQILAAGTYFVRVFPATTGINTSYSLSLVVDQVGNSINDALAINVDATSRSFSDFLNKGFGAKDPEDFYRFSFTARQDLNLALNSESQYVTAQLIQDLNGNSLVDSNEILTEVKTSNLGQTVSLKRTLDPGTYWLRFIPYVGSTNYTMTVSTSPVDWLGQNLQDLELINLTRQLASDGQLSRADAIALLRLTENGGIVSQSELVDLRKLFSAGQLLNMPESVQSLGSKVVSSRNLANFRYQGAKLLDNLTSDYRADQMELLISKWFFGSDHPIAKSEDGLITYSYRPVSGALFKDGPSYQDVRQGVVGNCYFLAALAAAAFRAPNLIQDMFIDNADGTFTVRFYNDGVADYITVDRYLPTRSLGTFTFGDTGSFYDYSQNELWVLLAEKAYAQMNELNWIGQDGSNSYQGIGYGSDRITLGQITGRTTSGPFTPLIFTELVSAFNAGRLVCLDSNPAGTTSNIVASHVLCGGGL